MQPLISLIIPVYNVEKYFPKCMESVFAQTYSNFEIILVDDGSTDNSGKMCDTYAEQDVRVKVFHKTNGGLSDARNFGVARCSGDLVAFIDSDDFVTNDYLSYLYELMAKYNADVSVARKILVSDGIEARECLSKVSANYVEKCLSAEEALQVTCERVSAYHRLYKKHLVQKHPYPVGKIYEDLATTYKIIADCDSVAISTKTIYFYVQRAGSICYSQFSDKHLQGLDAAAAQLAFMRENFPTAVPAAERKCASLAVELLSTTSLLSDKKNAKNNFRKLRDYLKPHIKYVLFDKTVSVSLKMSALIILMGYYPTKLIWPLRQWLRNKVKGY